MLPETWRFLRFEKVILYCKFTYFTVGVCLLFLLICFYWPLCWCKVFIIIWFYITFFRKLQRQIRIYYIFFKLWTLVNLFFLFQKTNLWTPIKPRLIKEWRFLFLLSFCSVFYLMTTLSTATNFFQLLLIHRLKWLNVLFK